eukprot:CAMPEP_0113688004 /NCGR_PEP_ID=MMETSP0038_2-20120614/16272_1 /TAXON_ID=2898 /ORGANISM="Cryptomonas paramecium" /LENGTH=197 /DNA_ID=CAMNT_0000608725 /DNA_START=189 /DNA_END=780 /DNA_ORIENTATION=- /assembly_acc=CAM_ASM_000170
MPYSKKDSRRRPKSRVSKYIKGLCHNIQFGLDGLDGIQIVHFLVALVYLQRLCSIGMVITQKAINSLILVSLVEAAKFLDHGYPRSVTWGDVGGVTKTEMKRLERHFTAALHQQLAVSAAELAALLRDLVDFVRRAPGNRACSPMVRRFRPRPLPQASPLRAEDFRPAEAAHQPHNQPLPPQQQPEDENPFQEYEPA